MGRHHFDGFLSLDEHLVRHTQLLADFQGGVVVVVALVDVHADAVLGAAERLLQGGHAHGVNLHAMCALEAQALDFRKGQVRHSGALVGLGAEHLGKIGGTLHIGVVAEHQHGVRGHMDVQFHNVGPHADDAFNGRDGILRVVAPVSAVAGHHHILGLGIAHLGDDTGRTVGVLRRTGTGGQGGTCKDEGKNFLHIAFRLFV